MDDQPTERIDFLSWGAKFGAVEGIEALIQILSKARKCLQQLEDAEFAIMTNVQTGQIDFLLMVLVPPETGETLQEFLEKPEAAPDRRILLHETLLCQKLTGSKQTGLRNIE